MPASEQRARDAGTDGSAGPRADPGSAVLETPTGVSELKYRLYELPSVVDVRPPNGQPECISVTFDTDRGRGTGSVIRLMRDAGWWPVSIAFDEREITFRRESTP